MVSFGYSENIIEVIWIWPLKKQSLGGILQKNVFENYYLWNIWYLKLKKELILMLFFSEFCKIFQSSHAMEQLWTDRFATKFQFWHIHLISHFHFNWKFYIMWKIKLFLDKFYWHFHSWIFWGKPLTFF